LAGRFASLLKPEYPVQLPPALTLRSTAEYNMNEISLQQKGGIP